MRGGPRESRAAALFTRTLTPFVITRAGDFTRWVRVGMLWVASPTPGSGARDDRAGSLFPRTIPIAMKPEPLIQKLFAIERAIDHTSSAELREMVIEAQEVVLRMDLERLEDIEHIRRRLEMRRLDNEESDLSRSA